MPRHQGRRHRQYRHQSRAFCTGHGPGIALGFITIQDRHQDKHGHVKTEDAAHIKALHHALAQP